MQVCTPLYVYGGFEVYDRVMELRSRRCPSRRMPFAGPGRALQATNYCRGRENIPRSEIRALTAS